MPQFALETFAGQIFWLAITFGLTYLVCWRWVLPRLGQVIEARATRIASYLDEAQTLNERAEALVQECEQRHAVARDKVRQAAEKAREDIAKFEAEQRAQADKRLKSQINEAHQAIAHAKADALDHLAKDAPQLLAGVLAHLDPGKTLIHDPARLTRALGQGSGQFDQSGRA
ncbi:MAG: ATP F0F1 synthase subunit B [Pseudomonadota bacterium]